MHIEIIIILSLLIVWFSLTIFELTNIHRFNLKFFDYGFTILKREIDQKFINWNGFDGIYEEKEGKYVFIPEMRIGYFVTKFEFYRRYGLIGIWNIFPLTIFGHIKEIEGKLIIEYKISYRLVFLFAVIILFWLYLPILTEAFKVLLVSFVGILLTCLIVYIIFSIKKTKMFFIADEIKKLLKVK